MRKPKYTVVTSDLGNAASTELVPDDCPWKFAKAETNQSSCNGPRPQVLSFSKLSNPIDLLDSTAPTHPAPSIQCLSLLRLYQVDYYGNFPISYGPTLYTNLLCAGKSHGDSPHHRKRDSENDSN
jgi:hypothetical protein